ncbi:unnamed protein product [Nippostrongylus brasiliensis]|uniref:Uncharacterized protein n=1 Tax=Nippostrongylus brasiliensis TaxID=27835 RepID=A0A0N4XN67_NIPBR|nr:unnamed protein product [Nippostrongylus brasiliensis]
MEMSCCLFGQQLFHQKLPPFQAATNRRRDKCRRRKNTNSPVVMDDRTSAPGLPSDGYKMAAESRPLPVAPQSNNKPTLAVCNSVRVDLCALSCVGVVVVEIL